jgi:hypothetical protein
MYVTRHEFTRFMHDICDQIAFLRRDLEELAADIRKGREEDEEWIRRWQAVQARREERRL